MSNYNCYGLFGKGHDFDKWEVFDKSIIQNKGKEVGFTLTQVRICSKCGFRELHIQNKTIFKNIS